MRSPLPFRHHITSPMRLAHSHVTVRTSALVFTSLKHHNTGSHLGSLFGSCTLECGSVEVGGIRLSNCQWPFRCCSTFRPPHTLTEYGLPLSRATPPSQSLDAQLYRGGHAIGRPPERPRSRRSCTTNTGRSCREGSESPIYANSSAREPSDHHHTCRQCQKGGRQRWPSDQPALRGGECGGWVAKWVGGWREPDLSGKTLATFAMCGSPTKNQNFPQNLRPPDQNMRIKILAWANAGHL